MKRLAFVVVASILAGRAHAIAILPGGNGGAAASGTVVIGSSTTCLAGEGAVSNGTSWACTSVSAGSGDSASINGTGVTDINILDTSGDGAIVWTRDAAPTPDTASAVVKDAAISVAKLKSADFGDWTCNGSSCTIDNDAIALGTKTSGPYIGDITVTSPLQCANCNLGDEGQTKSIILDTSANVSLTGEWNFVLGHLRVPEAIAPGTCNASKSGSIQYFSNGAPGAKLNLCTDAGTWEAVGIDTLSVDGSTVVNPNWKSTGDLTYSVSGSDITPTIAANAVALGNDTTGNYVGTVASSGHVSCSGCTPGEGAAATLSVSGLDAGDMSANLDFSGKTSLLVPTGATPTTSAAGWIAFDTNAQASGHGSFQYFDGTANAYVVGVLTSSTPQNGYVPIWNTGGTITWGAQSNVPAGSGTELQYRAGAVTLGAVSGSSVSGGNVTLTGGVTAATVTASDVTAEPGNRIQLSGNDTAFTNDPTCANSGTAGKYTIIDKDETASDSFVTCNGTTEVTDMHDSIILCGDNVNNSTTYLGPGVTGYLGTPTDYVIGGAACSALDSTTEATADNPIASNFPAFKVDGLYCRLSSDPANDVVVTVRSAAADLTPSITCTIAGTGSATSCRTQLSTTTDIAAGATIAVKVQTTEDLSAQDVWCKLFFTIH